MDGPRFQETLERAAPAAGIVVDIPSHRIVELAGTFGADFVVLDAEHAELSLEMIDHMVLAARATDTAALARLPGQDPDYIRRVLDLGADGIVVPRIESAADVEACVDAARYPPDGRRGLCSLTRSSGFSRATAPADFAAENDGVIVVGLIETAAAVEGIDDLFGSGLLDAAFLGPGDLAGSMGHSGALRHPDVVSRLDAVIDAGRDRGVPIGAYAVDAEDAADWMDRGAAFVYYSDVRLVRAAIEGAVDAIGSGA